MGKPSSGYEKFGTEARIQLNDQFASLTDVGAFISAERSALREELIPYLTVSLKVDRAANMGIVSDVKQELRKVNALKINYTTGIGDVETNMN
ncbi:MAG: biopolymer transporter ExbD, partial [Bacteroidota bacterium]|nr:biopolymer transporter ExbD [Bacteroidota bacterium]